MPSSQLELFEDEGDGRDGGLRAVSPTERPPRGNGAGLRFVVLGSGSSGNAVVVESAHGRLLIDAGFSCRELCRRLRHVGLEPDDLDALILTHEHSDHTRGARVLASRHRLPIYGSRGTLEVTPLGGEPPGGLHAFRPDAPFEVAGFELEPFLVPHDAREPVGLVITEAGGARLGLAGDLGCRSRLAWARLQWVDALLLETNHDLEMLRQGPYPWPLKQRVAGRHGHLSNAEAALGLVELAHDRLEQVVLYHLSRTNNLPGLALATVAEELERLGSSASVVVSDQHNPTEWLEIG
jgi:phosphoribosyl 1,2-cyclic phosphodiesterase